MSILALRRRQVESVPDLRAYHADLAPKPVTTPPPARPFRPIYPGVSRDALADLRAADRAETADHARRMVLGPLLDLLAVPAPVTDHLAALAEEWPSINGNVAMLDHQSTREIDRAANDLYTQQWQLFEALGIAAEVTA